MSSQLKRLAYCGNLNAIQDLARNEKSLPWCIHLLKKFASSGNANAHKLLVKLDPTISKHEQIFVRLSFNSWVKDENDNWIDNPAIDRILLSCKVEGNHHEQLPEQSTECFQEMLGKRYPHIMVFTLNEDAGRLAPLK